MEKILMQAAIDAAWASEAAETRRLQDALFPDGKPSVDDFVATMADFVRSGADSADRDVVPYV